MTENCFHTNPLLRDGTSQAQRTLEALLPEYVAVDERNLEDLRSFATAYAEEINYFDNQNTTSAGQDWVNFFSQTLTDDQKNAPHYALFMAFLSMFEVVQTDLNQITDRHLDFYYREVLGLTEKAEVPDQVHVIFNLARNTSSALIEANTVLKAGKDDTGVDLNYFVEKDTVITPTTIVQKKALFVDKPTTLKPGGDYRLYSSPVADAADGKGDPIPAGTQPWKTFGYVDASYPNADRDQAEIGFAVASPVLRLAEGDRKVTFKIYFKSSNPFRLPNSPSALAFTNFQTNIAAVIAADFSGEEEWLKPSTLNVSMFDQNTMIVTAFFKEDEASIVDYNREALEEPFETRWPMARIKLTGKTNTFLYHQLKKAVVKNIEIEVEVDKVRNLIVQNDNGAQDVTNTFQPFGGRPTKGSNFYIGSQEVFSKDIDSLSLTWEWNNLPDDENGFEGHYWNYVSSVDHRKNDSFKVDIDILSEREWVHLADDVNLFSANTYIPPRTNDLRRGRAFRTIPFNFNNPNDGRLNSDRTIALPESAVKSATNRKPELEAFNSYNNLLKQGFIRLKLTGTDFGHRDYGNSLSMQMIKLANPSNNLDQDDIPPEPYTPEINELYLNYTASAKVSLNAVEDVLSTTAIDEVETNFQNRIDQFFHIHPFGVVEQHKYKLQQVGLNTLYLLPQYNDEGYLYLGLDGLTPPSTQSMLFQVAEGSNLPELPIADLKISYLRDNYWINLNANQITMENTNGLIRSGIIRFDVPGDATNTNTRMPEGMYWVRISVTENVRAVSNLLGIYPNAALATYENLGNDPERLRNALPEGTVNKLLVRNPSISTVTQPFGSFGGRIREQKNEFITRISERLRHKNRAITLWDYERITLEEFPSIYKVKAISHTRFNGNLDNTYSEAAPGHVSLIVVSNVRNDNAADPLKPKTNLSRLTDIRQTLEKVAAPCVKIHVQNPIYEEIRVRFQVKFRDGLDKGFFQQQLQEELIGYLAPWTSDNTTEISFGGSLHKSVILNFIEERDYVDYLSCFEMDQLVPGTLIEDRLNIDSATPSTSASIFTSAEQHQIEIIETETCENCDKNIVLTASDFEGEQCSCSDPQRTRKALCDQVGIGNMVISSDGNNGFIVEP